MKTLCDFSFFFFSEYVGKDSRFDSHSNFTSTDVFIGGRQVNDDFILSNVKERQIDILFRLKLELIFEYHGKSERIHVERREDTILKYLHKLKEIWTKMNLNHVKNTNVFSFYFGNLITSFGRGGGGFVV